MFISLVLHGKTAVWWRDLLVRGRSNIPILDSLEDGVCETNTELFCGVGSASLACFFFCSHFSLHLSSLTSHEVARSLLVLL